MRRAIRSLIDQTYSNWECIVVDDGGTDKSKEVVDDFQDDRIFYYHKENQERNFARNFGALKAKGEFLLFLDSDDEFLEAHLQNLANHIKSKPSSAFIFSPYRKVNNDGSIQSEQYLNSKDDLIKNLCHQNFIPPSAVCVQRKLFLDFQFPESNSLLIGEDLCLWLRLLCREEISALEKPGVQMNMHSGQTMTAPPVGVILQSLNELITILKNDECFSSSYLSYLNLIEASFYSLAALSAALNKDKKQALSLLKRAIAKNGMSELFRRRNQAVLKRVLLN